MSPLTDFLLLAIVGGGGMLSMASPIRPRDTKTITTPEAASCASGVHIIVARGSTEQAGEGRMGGVATAVKQQIAGSDSVGVPYPAQIDASYYIESEHEGVGNMTKLVQQYVTACPKTKIVLMGYSQGAQVALDTLCGNTEQDFPSTQPLASQYSKNIIAVVAFGDPSHVPGKPYDLGNSTRSGYFPRLKNNATSTPCDSSASLSTTVIHSYCDADDKYCDSGDTPNSGAIHGSYFGTYTSSAAAWVVQRYKAAKAVTT